MKLVNKGCAWILGCLLLLSACNSKQNKAQLSSIPSSLNLSQLDSSGLFGLAQQQLTPNAQGIIAEIELNLPAYKKGIYYRPFSEMVAAGNRVEPLWFTNLETLSNYKVQKPRMDDNINLGLFIMLQKNDGSYLALLPLVSNKVGNSFTIRGNKLLLTVATYGTQQEDVSVPLMSYAQSNNPYEAARQAWYVAMETEGVKENIDWRENKKDPEAYQYLGWCSWEHYKQKINEEIILNALKQMKSSPIPFRWMLIDDGYLHQKKGKLLSFGVDEKKFPNGWEPITSQKDDKIKWMGIWRNFNGYMGGVSPDHTMASLNDHLVVRNPESKNPRCMPIISEEAANAFYHEMTKDTKLNGFDMIKVDFQSNNFRYNAGASNAILGVHYNQNALEENCKRKNLQLLNCIAQQNFNVFNQKYSALIRGSIDYKISRERLDVTLVQNFTNAFWLGHTHWLDQDMFFANHKESARIMAIARALSGGPIYLSDEPEKIDDTVLKPLSYSDGRILGTLAPGLPLPESMMQDPYYGGKAFRVIAPLENNSAAIMAVNLNQDNQEVETKVSLKDYPFASSLIQPYKGLWDIPAEGILVYDHHKTFARILSDNYTFKLGSRKERLLQLSPIVNGWSVIGRPDKYLSAAAFNLLETSKTQLKIEMVEDGPILIWSDDKTPQSENFEFSSLGHGLWSGELKQANAHKIYTILSSDG